MSELIDGGKYNTGYNVTAAYKQENPALNYKFVINPQLPSECQVTCTGVVVH
jgi:hypothetical protein